MVLLRLISHGARYRHRCQHHSATGPRCWGQHRLWAAMCGGRRPPRCFSPLSVTKTSASLSRGSRDRGGSTGGAGEQASTCPRPAAQSHPGYCSTLSAGHMPPACRLCRPGAEQMCVRQRPSARGSTRGIRGARALSLYISLTLSLSLSLPLSISPSLSLSLSRVCLRWAAAASMHNACDAHTHTRKTMRPCIWAGPCVINIGFIWAIIRGPTHSSMATIELKLYSIYMSLLISCGLCKVHI